MAALSPKELAELRAQLEARETQLAAEVRALTQETAEAATSSQPGSRGDIGDQGEARTREAVRASEQQRDVMELRQIADARERMEQGRYGQCVDCGEPIPLRRLQALPFSLRCLSCQRHFEKTHVTSVRLPAGF